MGTRAAQPVSVGGFLLTGDEWQDEELRLALLHAWADTATGDTDLDCYESFEVTIDAPLAVAA